MSEPSRFYGNLKYVGEGSITQNWKSGIVVLRQQDDKWFLDTYLQCNPKKVFKSHELSKATVREADIKSQRLTIAFRMSGPVFHFKDEKETKTTGPVVVQLEKEVKAIIEQFGTKGQFKNRAEVCCNPMLTTTTRPVLGQRSSSQKSPVRAITGSAAKSPVFLFKSSPPEQRVPDLFRDSSPGAASSPHRFTSVKENKKSRQDSMESSPDDESKENQHRGLVCADGSQQSWKGDRQPLRISSAASFYGSSSQSSSMTPNFKIRRGSGSSVPVAKKRLAADISYSWNRTSTPSVTSRQHAPALQGFANIGNTCYMNAILQSLFSLDTLVTDLVTLQRHHGKMLPTSSLAHALVRLLHLKRRPQMAESQTQKLELLRGVKRAISSTARRFSGSQQHDAHEFLGQVLDQLKEEVVKVMKDINAEMDRSVVPSADGDSPDGDARSLSAAAETGEAAASDRKAAPSALVVNPASVNFEFEVVHSIECLHCQEQLLKAEQFNDLSLDIPSSRLPGVKLSLQDALDVFLEKEQIEYTCEKCGHKKAEVTHRFTKLPRVLILHLKRYAFDATSSHNSKMRQGVGIPRFITLGDHCDQATQPHTPFTSSMHNGQLKLSPGSALRRRKLIFTGERNGDTLPGCKMRRLSDDFDAKGSEKHDADTEKKNGDPSGKFEEDLELAIQLSKNESAPRTMSNEMEGEEEEDEQLMRALALSMKDYVSGPTDHSYTSNDSNNNNNADAATWHRPAPMSVDSTSDVAEADLANMTIEEQIQLAINRSLAQTSPHHQARSSSPMSLSPNVSGCSVEEESKQRTSMSPTETEELKPGRNCSLSQNASGHIPSDNLSEGKHDNDVSGEEMKDEVFEDELPFLDDWDIDLPAATVEKPAESSYADMYEMDQEVEAALHYQEHLTFSTLASEVSPASPQHTNATLHSISTDNEVTNNTETVLGPSSGAGSASTKMVEGSGHHNSKGTKSDIKKEKTDAHDQIRKTRIRHAALVNDVRSILEGAETGMTGFVSRCVGSIGCISQSHPRTRVKQATEILRGDDTDLRLPDLHFDSDSDGDTGERDPVDESAFSHNHHQSGKLSATVEGETEEPSNLADTDEAHMKPSAPLQLWSENETTPDKKDRKSSTEEKENMSPAISNGLLPNGHVNKQLEAKVAQHVARATEIEKGNQPFSYRLVSVVNHLGVSSSTGHYVSDVFDMRKQAWFSYDDNNVQSTSELDVRMNRTKSGYIFFYLSKGIYDEFCSKVPKKNDSAIEP